jgi:hypothetical protein
MIANILDASALPKAELFFLSYFCLLTEMDERLANVNLSLLYFVCTVTYTSQYEDDVFFFFETIMTFKRQ